MTKKIFNSMVAISVAVVFICVVSISCMLYGYFENIIKKELKNESQLLASELNYQEFSEDAVKNFSLVDNRVTLISPDGTVLFDSIADAKDMENHKNRDEIKAAINEGEGYSKRYSDTLSTETIYYAKKLDNNNILRIAQEKSSIIMLLEGVFAPVIIIFLITVLVAFIISKFISKKIVGPINEMDLSNIDIEEPYPELSPLIGKIRQQHRHITLQMEELERKQNEFIAITDNMSEGFILIDDNTDILSYNNAAIKLLGDGNIDSPKTAFELNRNKSFRIAVKEALAGKHSQQPLNTENKSYNIIANPVEEKNIVVGAVIVIVDVTEKEMREKLRREFTSNVSHELKTPLTTIYGVSDMLAEGMVKVDDIAKFAMNIREESHRMIELIDDIIKLSKLDEGIKQDINEKIDLYKLSKEVINRLSFKANENNINLYVEGDNATIKSVPSLCYEILYNLCENGIKYNKPGGNVIIIIKKNQKSVFLTVEDTGIGIPYEYKDRIFERFFRIDKSHNKNISGTGLGLSIVKHAVMQIKGKISVDSVEGTGTKITVEIPYE